MLTISVMSGVALWSTCKAVRVGGARERVISLLPDAPAHLSNHLFDSER